MAGRFTGENKNGPLRKAFLRGTVSPSLRQAHSPVQVARRIPRLPLRTAAAEGKPNATRLLPGHRRVGRPRPALQPDPRLIRTNAGPYPGDRRGALRCRE